MNKRTMREYRAWKAMKARCYSPCNKNVGSYQRKGIKVCDRWRHDFDAFLSDMGKVPGEGYSLERIDNDKDYEPRNCKWIPMTDQPRNRGEFHKFFTYQGETKFLKDWARHFGVNYTTLYNRIYRSGMSFEEAIIFDKRKSA